MVRGNSEDAMKIVLESYRNEFPAAYILKDLLKQYPPFATIPFEHRVIERGRIGLEEELKITDKLLNDRNKLLDLIPECPVHGKQCLPHMRRWILAQIDEKCL